MATTAALFCSFVGIKNGIPHKIVQKEKISMHVIRQTPIYKIYDGKSLHQPPKKDKEGIHEAEA